MMQDPAGGSGDQRAGSLTTIVTLPATPTEPSRPIARRIPFVPDRVVPALRAKRLAAFFRRARRFPNHRQLFLHPRPGRRWAVLFCYQPEPGPIDPGHRFTIARLQTEGFAVLVVLAALLPGALSYTSYAYIQRELGATRTGLMLYLSPLYAALLAWALLGEPPRGYHAVGAALILPSIWLATRR